MKRIINEKKIKHMERCKKFKARNGRFL